jgi:predicted metal-binding protein
MFRERGFWAERRCKFERAGVEVMIIPFCGKCLGFKVPCVAVRVTALAAVHRLRHDRGN